LILDFDQLRDGQPLEADVCIVGAGAAGITLALELSGAGGHSILMIESGGERHEGDVQQLGETDCADELIRRSLHEGRARVFGGTTTLWAGQVMPLDESDFERRDWVPAVGWPFARRVLEPYYRRADRILALEPVSYDEDAWPARSSRPPPLDPAKLRFRFSRFSPTPDLARAHRARLANASPVTVLLHASAVKLETTVDGSSIERIELRSLSGKSTFAAARQYVLCCGAVETARILLASGVGNDLVGRYFQEHVHVKLPVRPASRRKFQAMFNTRHVNGARYYPKLVASRELQRRHELLNVGGDVCYEFDPDSALESAKLVVRALRRPELRSRLPRAAANLATRPYELFGAAYRHFALKHKLSEGGSPIFFCVQCESPPDPDNRVTLGRETDALGMPRALVHWRISELERRSIEVFGRTLAEEFSDHGIGEIDLSSISDYAAGFHHLGTTRMHDDPSLGAVDGDCRLHGIKNLYVGSGSVFPAGGYSNPTLTIMALCVRLADHLKAELA
jgi:choline dehydrogenase-like flavoprotein